MRPDIQRLNSIVERLYGGSKPQFAEALGVSASTIYPYLDGTRSLGAKLIQRLSNAGLNPEWVRSGEGSIYANNEAGNELYGKFGEITGEGLWNYAPGETPPEPREKFRLGDNIKAFYGASSSRTGLMIPIHSVKINCGVPRLALDDYITSMFNVDKMFNKQTSFVEVEGDSMKNAGVDEGDLLLVKKDEIAHPGNIIVASINGELTLKRIKEINGETLLYPENPDYEPIKITPEMDFQIVGVVVLILKDPRKRSSQ